jgi:hypothetical protein
VQRWYKLVSASLVLMALLAPSLSLALCTPPASDQGMMHCPPDCPMMAASGETQSQPSLMGSQTDGQGLPSCCTIGRSDSVPAKASIVVPPLVALEPPLIEVPFYAAVVPEAPHQTEPSPPPLAGTQALLCTFLI